MNQSWLEAYLRTAARTELCTKINCTTCGATEFRQGLLHSLSQATGYAATQYDRHAAIAILQALAAIPSPGDDPQTLDTLTQAVRCVLFEVCACGIPLVALAEAREVLGDCWAGNVLESMEAHDAARRTARREHEAIDDPAAAQRRRDARGSMRQEAHRVRLTEQRERSRIWHENHPEGDADHPERP